MINKSLTEVDMKYVGRGREGGREGGGEGGGRGREGGRREREGGREGRRTKLSIQPLALTGLWGMSLGLLFEALLFNLLQKLPVLHAGVGCATESHNLPDQNPVTPKEGKEKTETEEPVEEGNTAHNVTTFPQLNMKLLTRHFTTRLANIDFQYNYILMITS